METLKITDSTIGALAEMSARAGEAKATSPIRAAVAKLRPIVAAMRDNVKGL